MQLCCTKKDCYTEWKLISVKAPDGIEYPAYECRCTNELGEEVVCWHDAELLDLVNGNTIEAGVLIKLAKRTENKELIRIAEIISEELIYNE